MRRFAAMDVNVTLTPSPDLAALIDQAVTAIAENTGAVARALEVLASERTQAVNAAPAAAVAEVSGADADPTPAPSADSPEHPTDHGADTAGHSSPDAPETPAAQALSAALGEPAVSRHRTRQRSRRTAPSKR